MPAISKKQANAARLAGAVKAGKFPASKAGPAVKSMAKMSKEKLKHFMKMKESMTIEQKRRLLVGLRKLKESGGNIGGTTDITNADNLVAEDEFTSTAKAERNVIAKTWDTTADFDTFVNSKRGVEMTPKEQQAIFNFKKAKPTQQDKYFVKYETTDSFGNNNCTVIKKLQDGNQLCWTAFSKNEGAEEEGQPEEKSEKPTQPEEPSIKEATPEPTQPEAGEEFTVEDSIRIIKTITFNDEIQGSDILADLLNSGKLGI